MHSGVLVGLAIIILYLIFLLFEGRLAARTGQGTSEGYFMANRSLGTFVLAMTLMATLNSSFTFVAVPGISYVLGPGIFAGGFGGLLIASLMFYLVGYPAYLVGKKYGFRSPVDLFADRFESPAVGVTTLVCITVFLLPYLALQFVGGGHLFNGVTQGVIPYVGGAAILLAVTTIYVWQGGLKAVTWTDVIQGLWVMGAMIAMLLVILFATGHAGSLARDLIAAAPQQVTRAGPIGHWTAAMTLSWAVLVGVNLATQPQMFQRFLVARNVSTLQKSIWLFPVLCLIAWLPAVLIGMYGRLLAPGLRAPDAVMPTLIAQYLPVWAQAFIVVGGLAAIMSTADSQMLVLSQIYARDVYRRYIKPDATTREEVAFGRLIIVVMALIAFVIAIRPPALMAQLGAESFVGFVPVTVVGVAAFYWRRATAAGVITSLVVSEAFILAADFGLLPKAAFLGFDTAVPALVLSVLLLVVVSLFTRAPSQATLDKYFGFLEPILTSGKRRAPAFRPAPAAQTPTAE